MKEEKTTYEVWGFLGQGSPAFVSDDPVEIVHWLRALPEGERCYNVHPVGRGFHTHKMIAHDFISKHSFAASEDIVEKAFKAGKYEGLVKELHDLFFGR
ncbi:hypothetical protein [Streptomyces phage Psst4]|nr:hypothetical protein [Streptomyces phage Psst4]